MLHTKMFDAEGNQRPRVASLEIYHDAIPYAGNVLKTRVERRRDDSKRLRTYTPTDASQCRIEKLLRHPWVEVNSGSIYVVQDFYGEAEVSA